MAWVRASMPLSAVTFGGQEADRSGSTAATRGRRWLLRTPTFMWLSASVRTAAPDTSEPVPAVVGTHRRGRTGRWGGGGGGGGRAGAGGGRGGARGGGRGGGGRGPGPGGGRGGGIGPGRGGRVNRRAGGFLRGPRPQVSGGLARGDLRAGP